MKNLKIYSFLSLKKFFTSYITKGFVVHRKTFRIREKTQFWETDKDLNTKEIHKYVLP